MMRMMIVPILKLGALVTYLAGSQQPIDSAVLREANCHLRLTSDYVQGTIMYSDVAKSASDCEAKAARFSTESNLASMREHSGILFYEVEFRGRLIAKVSLK